jgi:hypothetical protein
METNELSNQITDVTASMPKVINPSAHAVLDYLTAGTFLAAGLAMRTRHRAASNLAFMNGFAVLGLSMLTDYPGGVFRTISFRTHGVIDVLQAGMSAFGPALMGFAGDAEAQMFHTQAAVEAAVIAATDWDSLAATSA